MQRLACTVVNIAVGVVEYLNIHVIHGRCCSFWKDDSESQRRERADSRQRNVQLTVTVDVREQVNANLIKRATFVDGHGNAGIMGNCLR